MRNWEDGQNAGAHPSRIIQPAEPVNQNHCKQGFYQSASANAFLGPAFNACLDAHADVDPALLRYSRLPVQLPDHKAVAAPDPTRPTRTLIGHRPSPIIIPATHEQSTHIPLHRRFLSTSPISTGSNLSCLALPTPVKMTINGKMQEEDVVVMEGVLVTSSASTGTWPRSSPAAAGSSLSPTSLSSTSVLYKTEMCRSWEETGACRYGARCQFAHGKQELRPVPSRNKPEVNMPRVSAQAINTPREVLPSEEERK
ncbi:uncharacterized protein LOC116247539 [Nymphaea colorata]|uniref:uncharacterized protein LOC116247539 n=1 Tax=Nymphaea colorata TaxID=210225 RepID=UPI00129D80C4|nr:uncharacterized protein LOC116247539 [Nymphaea colorata]